jgi:2-octaprenyl-6-methoxyphenol hydroxylase
MQMRDHQIQQIVVVGAGLTGVMTALALSYCGYGSPSAPAVTLVDRVNQTGKKAKTATLDHRTTTIHAAGKAMLDALGVWPLIAKNVTPISRIKVANGQPHLDRLNQRKRSDFLLDWQDNGTPMAYVVSNQDLLDALYNRLAARPIIQIAGHEVTEFDPGNDFARLQFERRPDLICQLVVGCDGANSKLREYASIRTFRETHRQTAIVANLISGQTHENTAFQRFLPGGPIALMPHGERRVSLVWSLPRDEASRILALDEDDFVSMVVKAFGNTLGELKLDGPRLSWPLRPTITSKMTSHNLILAGDASHAIHPLAGQGYNLALGDAAVLADCLAHAYRRGLSVGHQSIRSEYSSRRRLEVSAMTATTSGLNQLMSFQPMMAKIAGVGMGLVNRSPLKTLLQRGAMGGQLTRANLLEGRLPE